jgi:DNA-binding transcriptional LysR family regulator
VVNGGRLDNGVSFVAKKRPAPLIHTQKQDVGALVVNLRVRHWLDHGEGLFWTLAISNSFVQRYSCHNKYAFGDMSVNSIGLEQWRLFLQIAERGSLTETAMARDVAQSAISRQLAVIESSCGGKLFERHAHGVRLNEVGQRLYPQVREWVQRSEELVADARGLLRVPSGTVRVGIIESLASDLIAPLHGTVSRQFPGIQLRVVCGLSGRLTEALQAGTVDVALYSDNGRERVTNGLGLGAMPHLLVGAMGDPVTGGKTMPFEALHDLPLVVPGRPYAFHDVLEHWAHRKGIRLNIVLECDSLGLQKQLVAQGGVYAIMAASALRDDLLNHRLQASRIVRPILNRRLVLKTHQAVVPTQATMTVTGILKTLISSRLQKWTSVA